MSNNSPSFTALCSDLEHAIKTRGDAWRIASLATLCNDRPAIRTVILRQLDTINHTLKVFTDRRSEKLNQLTQNPHCALLCWCPQRQQQLRLSCHVTVKFDQHHLWQQLNSKQQLDYATTHSPGEILNSSQANFDLAISQHNFCVLECRIEQIEWLQISPNGHRRARVSPDNSQWICP